MSVSINQSIIPTQEQTAEFLRKILPQITSCFNTQKSAKQFIRTVCTDKELAEHYCREWSSYKGNIAYLLSKFSSEDFDAILANLGYKIQFATPELSSNSLNYQNSDYQIVTFVKFFKWCLNRSVAFEKGFITNWKWSQHFLQMSHTDQLAFAQTIIDYNN